MIIQIHITDNEIQAFFVGLGYDCSLIDLPQYFNRTHGSDEINMVPTLIATVDELEVKANALMNEYVKLSILNPASTANVNIDQAARNIAKSNAIKIKDHSKSLSETNINQQIINL